MKNFTCISVKEVNDKLSNNENIVVLDIRDPASYQQSHLPTAKHLSNDNLVDVLNQTPKTSNLIVYCYHGVSSQAAAKYLMEQGYEHVFSMDGGFTAWQQQYPQDIEASK